MKKSFLMILLSFTALTGFAQIGTSFQFSNLPFWGINYEFIDRIKPELRLSTDAFFENVSVETIVTYDILNKDDYELYAGLGGRFPNLSGFVMPVGMILHPFQKKNFGLNFEVAPVFGGESNLLRGSVGISYKFDLKGNQN
jgi:hypothetical protein